MNVPCPVHEGRRAHRGCRHCRRAICRLCELQMRGHLYCSPRCAREDGRLAFWRPVREILVRPVPPRLALAALALGAAAPVLLALRTVGELDRLIAPGFRRRRCAARRARIESVTPGRRRRAHRGQRVALGSAVFLFGSGGLVAATPVRDGRFRFDAVRDPGPYRVGLCRSPPRRCRRGGDRARRRRRGAARGSALRTDFRRASRRRWPSPRGLLGPSRRRARPPCRPVASARRLARPPFPARASPPFPDLTRGPQDRPELARLLRRRLFGSRGARQILAALAERGIRTTIFLTGDFIRRYPDIARRIAADGHEVGNHTDTHPHLTTYAQDGRQATRRGVDRAFVARTAPRRRPRPTRAATGRDDGAALAGAFRRAERARSARWAAQEGYWHVGWTGGRAGLDGLDWVSDPTRAPYRTAGRRRGSPRRERGERRNHPAAPRQRPRGSGRSARSAASRRARRAAASGSRAPPTSSTAMGMTEERLAALSPARGGGPASPTP